VSLVTWDDGKPRWKPKRAPRCVRRGIARQTPVKKRKTGPKARREAEIKRLVRAACVERDGYCLVQKLGLPGCKGESTWAHLSGHRRSQTRGMAPERRHDTRFSAMLCTKHHDQEETGKFQVVYLTAEYCDGPVLWEPKPEKEMAA
jgi:hypothetical protein